ncbi:hypothetical protein BHE90_003970 [Fusarium euwallaceae]|nr:hypothetical protein BHE90_003970 [Fusarium euwallaceae]
MSNPEISPKTAPSLVLPPGKVICQVSAVDTTANLAVPSDTLVQPPIPGHELMNFPTIAFLITHPSGDQVMFDLGTRKDFWNLPPPTAAIIDAKIPGINIKKNVIDILVEGRVDPKKLRAAIISHWHFDHVGDPSTFPETMEFIVGPGFSRDFLPGYPTVEGSPFFEGNFKDRKVNELSFSDLVVAGYRAVDYFGDGSLYILDTPGHAVGHISALVRTTVDTFAFLGGDICHFGGSFRPTQYTPMPAELSPADIIPHYRQAAPFACSLFTACHPDQSNARTSPYYQPRSGEGSWYIDPPTAAKSIEGLTVVDADEKVLVLIAHDPGLLHTLPFFPNVLLKSFYNKHPETMASTYYAWAVVEHGKPLQKIELPIPEPTGTEILIKVSHCSVCHSDLHFWEGSYDLGGGKKMHVKDRGATLPRALGHEIVGTVTKLGPDVDANTFPVSVGDSRAVYPWVGCQNCGRCEDEHDNLCLAQKTRVDYGNVEPSLACTFGCSGLTVLSSIKKLMPLKPHEPILLIGAGGVGLTEISMLKALGHKNIISADISPEKRAAALKAGATAVVDSAAQEAFDRIIEAAGGPLPGAIDFVACKQTAELALACVGKGGKVIAVGLVGGEMSISMVPFTFTCKSLIGNITGNPQHMREVSELARSGRLESIPITEVPWEQANKAIQRLAEGKMALRSLELDCTTPVSLARNASQNAMASTRHVANVKSAVFNASINNGDFEGLARGIKSYHHSLSKANP